MNVYGEIPLKCPAARTAVAIGMFDGLHRGHMAVLNALISEAGDMEPCVFTFSAAGTQPGAKTNARLLSSRGRDSLLSAMGVSYVFEPEFLKFRDMPPDVFVKDFLIWYLNAGLVFCGEDLRFGKDAAGSTRDLRDLLGARARIIPVVEADGEAISTTRIRRLIEAAGDMPKANSLLGREFTIDFEVEHGRRLGRRLDWPTINQPFPDNFVIPRFGVYASAAFIEGQRRPSVTNVGVRPTVGGGHVLAETYIRGFSGDLYGQSVPVSLLKFIRPERKFESLEDLKKQIKADNRQAAYFSF